MSSLSHSASPFVVVVVGVRGFSMPLWGGGGAAAAAAAAGAGGGSRSKKDEEEVEKRSTPLISHPPPARCLQPQWLKCAGIVSGWAVRRGYAKRMRMLFS